jgi:hypothetical protein
VLSSGLSLLPCDSLLNLASVWGSIQPAPVFGGSDLFPTWTSVPRTVGGSGSHSRCWSWTGLGGALALPDPSVWHLLVLRAQWAASFLPSPTPWPAEGSRSLSHSSICPLSGFRWQQSLVLPSTCFGAEPAWMGPAWSFTS